MARDHALASDLANPDCALFPDEFARQWGVTWYHFNSLSSLISDPNPHPYPYLHEYPKSYRNPNPIPNPSLSEKWNLYSRFGEHKSRDHLKAVFRL